MDAGGENAFASELEVGTKGKFELDVLPSVKRVRMIA
jgi:hypothetical protein